MTRAAGELGIEYLTLYAFSTENWQRSPEEVNTLMDLLRDYLKSDLKEVQDNGVRIRFIGERDMLAPDIVENMKKLEAETAGNTKMTLCIALSYGSRHEIVNAARKIAMLAKEVISCRKMLISKCFLICSTPKIFPIPIWLSAAAANSGSVIICSGRLLIRNFISVRFYGPILIRKP